jgi:hypothetical protein
MKRNDLDRRTFNKLTAAALGGMMTGAVAGCDFDVAENADATGDTAEKHLCKGLNECKGQGAEGKNDCRGMGACATYEHHACGGKNACKGQGGCGQEVGANECKGEGGCEVPLMDSPLEGSAWETMRKRMEEKWNKAELEFGDAPAKPEA